MSQERIDELLHRGVFHFNQANAHDIDSICIAKAMKCLIRYALHPSFVDLAYDVAFCLAQRELDRIEAVINGEIHISQRFHLPYILGRNTDVIHKEQLNSLISRLETTSKEKERRKGLEKAN